MSMSNISTLLFWLAVNYVPADSSFTGVKMFTVTLETAYTSLLELPLCNVLQAFLKGGMPCAECLIISDVRSLDEEDGEFMGTDAKVFCVFVRDRKSESVSDRLSTCCCSWQVEQAGLTQFD